MNRQPENKAPKDADARRGVKPVIIYPLDTLPNPKMDLYRAAREKTTLVDEVIVEPRDAGTFRVPAGHFFRIICHEGPQVGDLNLWAGNNYSERFFSGKTRALYGTHLSTGDQLMSCFPYLRAMATITYDTLDWYGYDEFGAGVHDVIGTRCDPYIANLLSGTEYHHCCHSNLIRAFSQETDMTFDEAEAYVHDVFNVFMCTGFSLDTHQYIMKASPARLGDYIELFAEIDLLGALSACSGGDCGSEHSSDTVTVLPLKVEIHKPDSESLSGWSSPDVNGYSRKHKD